MSYGGGRANFKANINQDIKKFDSTEYDLQKNGGGSGDAQEPGALDTFAQSSELDSSLLGQLSTWRIAAIRDAEELDVRMGFAQLQDKESRLGWLVNMQPTLSLDSDYAGGKAAIDFYFLQEDATTFKTTILFEPYFYVLCKPGAELDVEEYLLRRFERQIQSIQRHQKDDLTLPDHLIGTRRTALKLSFHNEANKSAVKRVLTPIVERNKKSLKASHVYQDISDLVQKKQDHSHISGLTGLSTSTNLESFGGSFGNGQSDGSEVSAKLKSGRDSLDSIIDLREFDVPYYVRAAMDS
ncbi:DNA polymerase epsilon catalytic subunit, partial [Nowakowskiella sp. JEL0078]